MKSILLTFLSILTLSSHAQAQLTGGAVVAEGRDVAEGTVFQIDGIKDGWASFVLAVDRTGKVTSAEIQETNLSSSIDKMQLKKHEMKLKFQPGTHYPKFHNAEVRLTMIKSENPPQEIEIIID